MSGVKNKGDKKMAPKDQTDSVVNDDGSCDGSSVGIVLKKGPWTSAEDAILLDYVNKHGEGNWNAVQKHTGLSRCGKSCRLRWANHLRPNLKKGALTPEEEQMIVQLHAKMGNKWAQMATFLPGRTDNEIKNYWNTRVKRRQRAVLPLYPQNVSLQVSNENQTSLIANEYNIGDKRSSKVVQGDVYGTLDTGFDPLKANPVPLSFSLPFPDVSFTSMLSPGLGSRHFILNRRVNPAKRFKESQSYFPGNHGSITTGLGMLEQFAIEPSEKIHQNIGLDYSYVPNLNSKNLVSFGCSIPGSHAQSNGNFSPSEPLIGSVKVELPSLQYPETDYCNWLAFPSASSYEAVDTYIQSPLVADSMQSDCASPRSSGLLEALVQESHTIGNGKKQSSERSSSCSATNHSSMLENSAVKLCSEVWEEASDPNSPFCRSAVSLFNQYTPTSNSPLDELLNSKAPSGSEMTQPSAEQVSTPNVLEKDVSHLSDFLRPDAFLGSDWHGGACQSTKETSSMNNTIAALLGEDSSNVKDLPGGTSSMLSLDTYQESNRSANCLNIMKFA